MRNYRARQGSEKFQPGDRDPRNAPSVSHTHTCVSGWRRFPVCRRRPRFSEDDLGAASLRGKLGMGGTGLSAAIILSPGAPFSYFKAIFSSYWEYRENGSGAGWNGRGLQEVAPKSPPPTGDARRKKKAVRVRRRASLGLLPARAVVFLLVAEFFFFAESSCRGAGGDKGRKQNQGGGNHQRGGGNGRPPPDPSYSPTQCSKRAIRDDVAS